jgi:hypothetical protein
VLIQGFLSNDWRLLTPDNTGSYVNGRWSTIATPQACFDTRFQAIEAYQPLYFASAVLPDGRVVVIGGEYNRDLTGDTNLGEIYDPAANTWSCLAERVEPDRRRDVRRTARRHIFIGKFHWGSGSEAECIGESNGLDRDRAPRQNRRSKL